MQFLKAERKPDRGPMLGYLATSSGPSRKDVQGVYRWLSGLRLADAAVQLPCADKVLAWIASFFIF